MFNKIFPNRNLTYLFSGQVISQIGDSIFQISLLWMVLKITGSKTTMGIVATASYLPMLLFGLIGGVMVDFYNRKSIMFYTDILRALLVLLIPLFYYYNYLSVYFLIGVTFFISSLTTLFNPARDSIIPSLVKKSELLKSNSLIQVSWNASILFGPVLAAILIKLLDLMDLFVLDSVTFVISAIFVYLIAFPPVDSGRQERKKLLLLNQIGEILRYLVQNKRLAFLVALTGINNFFIMGPAIVGIPVFVDDILHRDADTYALVESCLGAGMLLGSFLVNYTSRNFKKGKILLYGMIFDGLTYASLAYIGSTIGLMCLIALHAVGIPHIMVSRTALIQEWVSSEKLGRVFSIINMAVIGMTALSNGFTGWLADQISIQTIFGIFGLCAVSCGIVGLLFSDIQHQ